MIVSGFLIGVACGVSAGIFLTALFITLRTMQDEGTDIDSEVYRRKDR